MLDYDVDLDRVFHALADPGRRSMVERLSRGPASVSELGRPLGMTLSAVVQHVQVLEACGLVRTEKVGRTRTCTVEPAALCSAERWIADRRALWERRLDRLGEYLASTAEGAEGAQSAQSVESAEAAGNADAANVGAAHPAGARGDTTDWGDGGQGGTAGAAGARGSGGEGNGDRDGDDPGSGDECGDG